MSTLENVRVLRKRRSLAQDYDAWYYKFTNLKHNVKRRGFDFSLTFADYVSLAASAKLTQPSQIGRRATQYQIGRYGDCGGYHVGNCRFITFEQNVLEKIVNGGTARAAAKFAICRTGVTKQTDVGVATTALKLSRHYYIKSPTGKIYRGLGLRDFCKAHDLHNGCMSRVLRELKDNYKGWTGHYTD